LPLNDTTIRGIKPPEKGQKDYIDQHGLTLRVSQGGSKSWVFRHGAAGRRITIGKYPAIGLAAARQRARELGAQITLGQHRPKSLTYEQALELFVANHLKAKNRANTAAETERLLRKLLSRFGKRALSEITTAEIAAFLDSMARTPSEATHTFTALKTLYNFSFRRGYVEVNPLVRLQKPHKAKPRSRVLSPAELRSVLVTAQELNTTYARLLRLLIYTGQRLAQIQTLTDAHIDREAKTFTWSAEEMKGGEPHVIPYGQLGQDLLDECTQARSSSTSGTRLNSMWLFPGEEDPGKPYNNFSNDHRAFLKASGVAHFRRHDCRRVYSTFHASQLDPPTPPHVVEQILAHKNGRESGGPIGFDRYTQSPACLTLSGTNPHRAGSEVAIQKR
jgi:integrase